MSATARRVPHGHSVSLVLYRACGAILCLWFYPVPTVPVHIQCATHSCLSQSHLTRVLPPAGTENLELLVHSARSEHPITIQHPNVDYREVPGKQGW